MCCPSRLTEIAGTNIEQDFLLNNSLYHFIDIIYYTYFMIFQVTGSFFRTLTNILYCCTLYALASYCHCQGQNCHFTLPLLSAIVNSYFLFKRLTVAIKDRVLYQSYLRLTEFSERLSAFHN